jgi:hypothetical protein
MMNCERCNGTGEVSGTELYRGRRFEIRNTCTACNGTGKVVEDTAVVTLVIERTDPLGKTIVFPAANARRVMTQYLNQIETVGIAWSVKATNGAQLSGWVSGRSAQA